jgi:hypothetical protein
MKLIDYINDLLSDVIKKSVQPGRDSKSPLHASLSTHSRL